MNFKNFALVLVAMAAFFLVVNPVAAQMPEDEYIVQTDDNLWQLAGDKLGDPTVWERLVQANPFLDQPGRRFQRGDKIVVLLHPGERLKGLEAILRPMDITWDPVPFSALRAATPPVGLDTYRRPNQSQPWWTYSTFSVDDVFSSLLGLLLLLGVGLALALVARIAYLAIRSERALRFNPRHPEYQGTPMRQNNLRAVLGIPAPVSEHVNVIARLAGDVRGRLTEIVAVKVNGRGYIDVMTEYRDGNRTALPTDETLYLGVYREGETVTRVTGHWKACLNGLLFDQMEQANLLRFVQEAHWTGPHRIWSLPEFNPPFNFEPIRSWLEQAATDQMFGRFRAPEAQAEAAPTPVTPVTPVPTPSLIPEVSIDATGTIFQIGGQRFVLPASLPVQIQDGNIRIGTPQQVATSSMVPPTKLEDEHPTTGTPGNGVGARMHLE